MGTLGLGTLVYNESQLSLIHAVESRYRQPASPLLTSSDSSQHNSKQK